LLAPLGLSGVVIPTSLESLPAAHFASCPDNLHDLFPGEIAPLEQHGGDPLQGVTVVVENGLRSSVAFPMPMLAVTGILTQGDRQPHSLEIHSAIPFAPDIKPRHAHLIGIA